MWKMEEKQRGAHEDKPSHVRVRVFDMNVMDISQYNSINKGLGGLLEVVEGDNSFGLNKLVF